MKKVIFLVLVLISSVGLAEPISDSDIKSIGIAVEAIKKATLNSEYDVAVDYMPTRIVNLLGGRTKIVEATKAAMESLAAQNMSIVDYSYGIPSEIIVTSMNEIALVPTAMTLKSPQVTISSTGFLIASREAGTEKWGFIDSSGVNNRLGMETLYPGYPSNRAVPSTSYEVLEN